MKIKKIRKRIGNLRNYQVRETFSLFGDFFGNNMRGITMHDMEISTTSEERAILIYMRRYKRDVKQKNSYQKDHYHETTEEWARIMVTDDKGYKTFWA